MNAHSKTTNSKPLIRQARCSILLGLAASLIWLTTLTPTVLSQSPSQLSEPIPLSEVGAMAGAQYQGDGLSVTTTQDGAQLRCVFQKLKGELTREGLWLISTAVSQTGDKFRVVARAVGRPGALTAFPPHGAVTVADKLARYVRPCLTEEYSVSVDGVRQDFVVAKRPGGAGPLRVELDVTGAKAEALVNGARLVLTSSGRRIAYSRLHVVDAGGKELPARMEVSTDARLALLVEDAAAAYPVRIDPTFSDEDWISMGGPIGANDQVVATVVDGSGNLYIGGHFTIVGAALANGVAKWDGSAWSALGSGVNGAVFALAVSGSDLYVGGQFTTAGGSSATNVAQWNGTAWAAMEWSGAGYVEALAVLGSDLYVGGGFTMAGGSVANFLAKWNGSGWSALGAGLNNGVKALAVSGSDLYVGGYFTTAGGNGATNVAKWNGSAWSALGLGVNDWVWALAVSGGDLYVGGEFTTAGGSSANRVAKWNGSAWSALGSGLNGEVSALVVSGSDLFVGGIFNGAGGKSANYVAKWNGIAWSALGAGADGWVRALAVSGNDLYVGGTFAMAGGSEKNRIAKWNGSSWSALGSGLNRAVRALTVSGSDLYVGGIFTTAGGSSLNRVAKWNGSEWLALGSGLDGDVVAMAMSGSDLYVGGHFSTAGGNSAIRVAKWNGSGWSALGSGVYSPSGPSVQALAMLGGDLYVGGRFTSAGGISVTNVAKWNGSAWSALGSGIDGTAVYALTVSGSDLYVGGLFSRAGGGSAWSVAKWNGSAWSALKSGTEWGVHGSVLALAALGSDLYVGGTFTTADGSSVTNVGKWNGSAWLALGAGVNGAVRALAVSGNDLFAGGNFTTTGGFSAKNVAKWNGSAWSALGSGVDGTAVYALAVSGSDLYAGGDFITVGGKVSAYVARAILPANPVIINQPVSQTVAVGSAVNFLVIASGSGPLAFQWYKDGAGLVDGGNVSGASTTNLTIANVQAGDGGGYSVVVSNSSGSATSSLAVLHMFSPQDPVRLVDYYPLPLAAQWTYQGLDWDGNPAKSFRRVDATNTSITLYTGRSSPTSYTTNAVSEYNAYVNPTTMVPYDEWISYMAAGSRFGYFGDTGAGDIRMDGGGILPEFMTVGSSVTNVADAYVGGTFVGSVTLIIQLLERISLTVPAGWFPDVLRVRIATATPADTGVHDEWWARAVGSIKEAGVSGDGAPQRWELIQYSVPKPPIILTAGSDFGFVSNKFGFWIEGGPGQVVVVEGSSNLADWSPLLTNTLGSTPLYYSDSGSTNLPHRFYRVRLP